jgi:NACHT domain
VAKRMIKFREVEFRNLPDNEWNATLAAVKDTFEAAQLSSAYVIGSDLDARRIEQSLGPTRTAVLRNALLSSDAEELYLILLRKSCSYLVEIVTTLPKFQPEAFTELLRRSSSTLWKLEELLGRIPERRQLDDFEADYREQVIRSLDRMELFGASISEEHRSYPLRGAFVSLGVRLPDESELSGELDPGADEQPIENALAGLQRVLLLGEAGSGKTTLLRWLAVRSALGDFTRPLDGWNDCVPFYLPLRIYAGRELPAPSDFISPGGGRTIADEMPAGWVQSQLRKGRALVLIDGVDELRDKHERDLSRQWLADLIERFPAARYLVTSRPAAISPDWLSRYAFSAKAVQPMSMTRTRSLIRRWHATIGHDIVDDAGRSRLQQDETSLLVAVDGDRYLKALVINPLLCALICALNRDRRGHLPSGRMEIYRAALDMLLERRDQERGLSSPRQLTATARTILLQDFAFWLVRNHLSDAPTVHAEGQIARTPRTLPKITDEPRKC